MSDQDVPSQAWRISPSEYLRSRPASHAIPHPTSFYRMMRDGCRLAVDVYLPDGQVASDAWPTILIFTPYYRRFCVEDTSLGTEVSPNIARYRDTFVPRGYALVIVDVRGTGASFGTRDSFRSPREREDYGEIVAWVATEPWCNGHVGCTGISYLGAASDFLASTSHPAVKAIAPLFAVWDTYSDHYYPGGILLKELARVYDEMMVALDHDDRALLAKFSYYADPNLRGPRPVDSDADGSESRAAVAEHVANFRMPDFIGEFKYRDDTLPYDCAFSSASMSPYGYMEGVRAEVAVLSVSGWMDGAGYANGAISRFLTLPNLKKYLLLGPWDHGARINVSPWRNGETPTFPLFGEVLRFFDEHVKGVDTGLSKESPVHYFSLHGEAWREAPQWPPLIESRRLYLSTNNLLAAESPEENRSSFKARFDRGTGSHTRYERIAGLDCRTYYPDWHGRDETMLCYTSAPLNSPLEVAGHVEAALWVASSEPDFALFAYLSEVEPDGRVRYVTEGLLRGLHRKVADPSQAYKATWPIRSFARADASSVPVGEPQLLYFALLPTAWTFSAGSCIRLAFAAADADHCAQIPHGRPPILTFSEGGGMASFIDLPCRVP